MDDYSTLNITDFSRTLHNRSLIKFMYINLNVATSFFLKVFKVPPLSCRLCCCVVHR